MKWIKLHGGLLVGLLVNMLLNLEWSILAWIMLGLHSLVGLPIGWFLGGLGLWILRCLAGMWLIGWTAKCGSVKDPPKENKNPYSAKKDQYRK